jgi:hypothetical protein
MASGEWIQPPTSNLHLEGEKPQFGILHYYLSQPRSWITVVDYEIVNKSTKPEDLMEDTSAAPYRDAVD